MEIIAFLILAILAWFIFDLFLAGLFLAAANITIWWYQRKNKK